MPVAIERCALIIADKFALMLVSYAHADTRVLNAQIHPTVRFFMGLSKERLLQRYCHLNPNVNKEALDEVLTYKPTYLRYWNVNLQLSVFSTPV